MYAKVYKLGVSRMGYSILHKIQTKFLEQLHVITPQNAFPNACEEILMLDLIVYSTLCRFLVVKVLHCQCSSLVSILLSF